MLWQKLSNKIPNDLDQLKNVLLANRDITDSTEFFSPPHPQDFSLASLEINSAALTKSVKRIKLAIENEETVLIYGDYDADGICATAVMWKALKVLGLNAQPFIPSREKHGYGISLKAMPDIEKINPQIIITVDNGIVAHPVFKELSKRGIDCILTDHHQPEFEDQNKPIFPEAFSIVHTTKLCGTTVAWILARELIGNKANDLLDLCAIASVADQVPMKGENRAFVYHGMKTLQESDRVGIKALTQVSGVKQAEINSFTIGFQLAPRINAMGRIAQGMDALRLLCTTNPKQADQLAAKLQDTNANRQELTLGMFENALVQAEAQSDEKLLYVYSSDYHEGVIGLIAGKLTERFHKPAIAISVNGDLAKASARSIKGVNIIEMLRAIRSDLLEVGGHPLAGGFSLDKNKIEVVKSKLHQLAREVTQGKELEPALELECDLPTKFIQIETVVELQKFEPFGQANPKPLFQISNLKVADVKTIGSDGRHIKLSLLTNSEDFSTKSVNALWWNSAEKCTVNKGDLVKVAAYLDINEYKGRQTVQLIVKDCEAGN